MRKRLLLFIVLLLLLIACKFAQSVGNPLGGDPIAIPPTAAQPSATPQPTETPAPTLEPSASPRPSATATLTPVPREILLQEGLAAAAESEYWQELGLSEERKADWEAFVDGNLQLSESELALVESFIAQWQRLVKLMEAEPIPAKTSPTLRVREFNDDQGKPGLALYALDANLLAKGAPEQLFLIVYDKDGKEVAWLLAPQIEKLTQRASADGAYVEYLDADGNWLVKSDARKLDKSSQQEEILIEKLKQEDLPLHNDLRVVYPRSYLNIPGVESGFYAIENLTYNQILLLLSTLEIYNKPEFADLMPEIFPPSDDVVFVISREPQGWAAALAYPLGGTPRQGVVVLYTKNLFSNRFETAAALAHEAAHVWQGRGAGCDNIPTRLRREIGDRSIPSGFYDWTAAELIKAAKQGKIGAYHMTLWVMYKFEQTRYVRWLQDVIQTGQSGGQSVAGCD
jgi:hypothetical protein